MVNGQIHLNGGDQVGLGAKNATPNPVGGQVAKKAFHPVEPGRAGGREMEMKARISFLPGLHPGLLVRGVIVADHMDLTFRWSGFLDLVKETDPRLMPMLLHAGADDLSGGNV